MHQGLERLLDSLTTGELLEARRHVANLLTARQIEGRGAVHQPPPGATEQRRFDRYVLDVPMSYVRHADEGAGHPDNVTPREALLKDISCGGIGFSTDAALAPHEFLTVYLAVPDGVRKLIVEVLRSIAGDGRYQCGAEFVGVDRFLDAHAIESQQADLPKVLVVDRPGEARDALVAFLTRRNCFPLVAASVAEARALLLRHEVELVLGEARLLLGKDAVLLRELATADGVISVVMTVISAPSPAETPA